VRTANSADIGYRAVTSMPSNGIGANNLVKIIHRYARRFQVPPPLREVGINFYCEVLLFYGRALSASLCHRSARAWSSKSAALLGRVPG